MSKRYRQLPDLVYAWMLDYRLWLTGSGAVWYENGADEDNRPRDFDLFTPDRDDYNAIRRSILSNAEDYRINVVGGTKATLKTGEEVDVWPQSVGEYFSQAKRKGYSETVALKIDPYVVLRGN